MESWSLESGREYQLFAIQAASLAWVRAFPRLSAPEQGVFHFVPRTLVTCSTRGNGKCKRWRHTRLEWIVAQTAPVVRRHWSFCAAEGDCMCVCVYGDAFFFIFGHVHYFATRDKTRLFLATLLGTVPDGGIVLRSL